MMSPGLLLLLLALSSLPVLSAAPPAKQGGSSEGEQATDQSPKSDTGKWIKDNIKKFITMVANFFQLGPVADAALLFFPDPDILGSVNNEVKASYSKLDTVNAAVKWADYQKAINNVEQAWIKYTHMVRNQQITTGDKLKDFFLTFYNQHADSSLVLYQYLTAEPVSITQTLGDLLAERLRCHEADVNQQFVNLNELMCKGNELDRRFYEFKGLKTDARIKTGEEIASKSAVALFRSQEQCISNINHYIAMDVFDLIDDTKDHQVLADEIRQFLKSTYTKYEWMVVAFSTHNTKNLPIFRKFHILTGFIEVERGIVTVAVAKQLKGSIAKPTEVRQSIKKCFSKPLKTCNDVVDHLQKCKETYLNKPVPQIYTAVHIYRHESHTSTDAVPLPDNENLSDSRKSPSNEQSYLYEGECGQKLEKLGRGTFMILIKSDEEITGKDPCLKISCKNNGECVKPDKITPTCKCLFPFYGAECEKSLEEYKKKLQV